MSNRRQFITLLGGAAAAWPLAPRAQDRMRRIGALMPEPENYPESRARMTAFQQAGGISQIAVNATLAFVEGAKPQSEVESALLMQMGCTHAVAMAVLGRVAGAHGPTRSIAAMASAAARLHRTYAIQVETWRRLRNGGSQFVRVECADDAEEALFKKRHTAPTIELPHW